jgi:hypothetical protein
MASTNKELGLDTELRKAYSNISTGVATTVSNLASKLASKLARAHEMGVKSAFGVGDDSKPTPKQVPVVSPQAQTAPTITSPAATPPTTPPQLFNPAGARGEGFADVTSGPVTEGQGLGGGYFKEDEWAKAANELRSIIKGENPRTRTMWHFEPGVGRYSTEEAVPQNAATMRAAMAHLYGMFPERLKADVGMRSQEIEGKYGLEKTEIAAAAEREKIRALEGRAMSDDQTARDKLLLEAARMFAPKSTIEDLDSGEKIERLDASGGLKAAQKFFGLNENASQAQRPSKYDIGATVRPIREAHGKGDKKLAKAFFSRIKEQGKTPDDIIGLTKDERDWLWGAGK